MTERVMTCETFDERLSEYLEDTLTRTARSQVEAHRAACLRCAALVRDLEEISQEARALPELTPSRDLWNGIAARIEAPVVPIGTGIPQRRWTTVRLGAAAAALIVATAGVTYRITAHQLRGEQITAIAPDTAQPVTVAINTPAANDSGLRNATADSTPTDTTRMDASSGARVASAPTVAPVTTTYDREIETLRTIMRDRSTELDPRTVAILEGNLRVIDAAIAESRAALATDPASRFLREQLNRALDKKLELLRTAALLRPRT
jgi:hypothetical protein